MPVTVPSTWHVLTLVILIHLLTFSFEAEAIAVSLLHVSKWREVKEPAQSCTDRWRQSVIKPRTSACRAYPLTLHYITSDDGLGGMGYRMEAICRAVGIIQTAADKSCEVNSGSRDRWTWGEILESFRGGLDKLPGSELPWMWRRGSSMKWWTVFELDQIVERGNIHQENMGKPAGRVKGEIMIWYLLNLKCP